MNYDDPATESLWLREQREHVMEYLTNEALSYDRLAESPAWFVAPYVSIWTTIPKTLNERRLWIICGDLPADFMESSEETGVREVLQAFATRWRELSLCLSSGKHHPTLNVGNLENQQELGALLQRRAELLQQWANDDSIWACAVRPIHLPPEPILRTYMDLLAHVFVFLRNTALTRNIEPQELSDLADALHNVPNILLDYGRWTEEANFRETYLRPFDQKWAKKALSLEEFVKERLRMYGDGTDVK